MQESDTVPDRTTVVFDGQPPDSLACDTTLRELPDGSWVMVMLGGGHTEPLPQNRIFLTRSTDRGASWTPIEPVDLGIKAQSPATALVPSELMVHKGRCTFALTTTGIARSMWAQRCLKRPSSRAAAPTRWSLAVALPTLPDPACYSPGSASWGL